MSDKISGKLKSVREVKREESMDILLDLEKLSVQESEDKVGMIGVGEEGEKFCLIRFAKVYFDIKSTEPTLKVPKILWSMTKSIMRLIDKEESGLKRTSV